MKWWDYALIVGLVGAAFVLGGMLSCSVGGGEIVSGFSCRDVQVLGVCEFQQERYVVDGHATRVSPFNFSGVNLTW